MARVALISLGCPKNLVDSEEILWEVERAGHEIVSDPASAEVLVVNTCGFIRSAKDESIGAILDAVRHKTNGACRSVLVTGCMVQRYGDELAREIPEIDALVGLGRREELVDAIAGSLSGSRIVDTNRVDEWWTAGGGRILSTAPWTAYLRIADGCDNRCSYCAIPSIRGGYRSRPEQEIVDEAAALADSGVAEVILVAQDVTRYGLDLYGELRLARLLEKLGGIEGLRWIRLLYCHPARLTDDLIGVIAGVEKVCKYIDVPLQHCSDEVLRGMGRPGSKREYLELFERVRQASPDAALRSTLLLGFPGETEQHFEELVDLVQRVRFDRLGVFTYSREEGTPAASMKEQVRGGIARERARKLMALQRGISLEKNRSFIGKRLEVLVESVRGKRAVGRSYRDAPDIDGVVYIENAGLKPGTFECVEITAARQHDLVGRRVRD